MIMGIIIKIIRIIIKIIRIIIKIMIKLRSIIKLLAFLYQYGKIGNSVPFTFSLREKDKLISLFK